MADPYTDMKNSQSTEAWHEGAVGCGVGIFFVVLAISVLLVAVKWYKTGCMP